MDKINGELIMYFDVPFWVGVGIFERNEDGKIKYRIIGNDCKPRPASTIQNQEIIDYIRSYLENLGYEGVDDKLQLYSCSLKSD